jgi:hypothetical protein
MSRKDKQGNTRIDFPQAGKQIQRGAIGEHVISDDNVRLGCSKDFLRVAAALGFIDLVALKLKKVAYTEA